MDKQIIPYELTVIFTPIRTDLIERALDTLYKYTSIPFYVYIVDQTVNGLSIDRDKYRNLMVIRTPKTEVHYTGNLGFAKANNLAISLVTTPYFCLCNDDVFFINSRWWQGVLDAFAKADEAIPDRPCMSVTPGSIKLPDWSVGRPSGDDFYIIPYKKTYTEEDYDHLLNDPLYVNEHLTLMPGSVIDGVTLYCSVFKTKPFLEIGGMLDERWYPGGCEDYCLCCTIYMNNYRMVGTTMSWIYHHWSSSLSKEDAAEIRGKLIQEELRHGDLTEKWGIDKDGVPYHDIWAPLCRDCGKERVRTKDNIVANCPQCNWEFKIPSSTIMPL